ncbi:MAG TPA: hypothetical protein VM283_06195, partial [Armatimonadota bacterium]|nr:hypothetical protein [Armatimonadota bacterium]
MNMPLRWKIAASFTLAAAVILGGLGWRLHGTILRDTSAQIRDALIAQAHVVALALPRPPWQASADLDARVAELAAAGGVRITLIA